MYKQFETERFLQYNFSRDLNNSFFFVLNGMPQLWETYLSNDNKNPFKEQQGP